MAGTEVPARVAMMFGWESWWALEERGRPSDRLNADEQLLRYYVPFFERGVAVDVVPPGADLDAYALVVVPNLFLVSDEQAAGLDAYVRRGGVLVVGPFSGVADPRAHIRIGRFPAPLREVLGASGEEWQPVGEPVRCRWQGGAEFTADTWTELLAAEGAEVVAEYASGGLAGLPAVTRHRHGDGLAWYVGTMPEPAALAALAERVLADAGVTGVLPALPPGVEAVRRGEVLFVLNHGTDTVRVELPERADDLLTGATAEGSVTLAPREVAALVPTGGAAG
ncbi:beta-galactosidase trimerization domain-containing protein [Nonomuraea fastidiosa]|uniref:beta-galactosidase n=1 Tax=Nonomuraea fastidiosa TaxID=46173 RepID=UPI00366D6EE1